MHRVLIHNLSSKYISVSPELFNFDQNAIFFAETGDIVVVRAESDYEYLNYLRDIGVVPDDIHFVVSQTPSSTFSIFEDASIIQKIQRYTSGNEKEWVLDAYMYTQCEHDFAQRLGIVSFGNPRHYYQFGTKSGFRTFAKTQGVQIPRGRGGLSDGVSVGLSAAWLYLRGARAVVVKQDEGLAGRSLMRLEKDTFLAKVRAMDFKSLLPSLGVVPVISDGFVVEEWYQDVVSAPSIEFYISEGGVVSFSSMHEQIFFADGITYRGCRSYQWLPIAIQESVQSKGCILAEALAREGVRGPVAFDAIVRESGEVLFVEANVRRIMSSYAHAIARRISGQNEETVPYISLRVKKAEWKGKTMDDVIQASGESLYTRTRGRGIIPYDIGMLSSQGSLSLLCVGNTLSEVEDLYQRYTT